MAGDDFIVVARWDERGGFFPLPSMLRRCAETFGHGERLVLTVDRERSPRSHRHQFAEIRDLWATLPERLAGQSYAASPETLRKHALIATGYCDAETIVVGSKAAAERVAAYARKESTKAHGYSIVTVDGPVVRVFTPHSQSVAAMGGKVFQQSKTAVLDWIGATIQGVEPQEVDA